RCSVEAQRVEAAVLALDHVAAVAWIPDEGVVACAELGGVVAFVPVDAVAADRGLDALAAGDRVVARSTIKRECDCAGRKRGGVDRVGTAEAVHGELVSRLLVLDRDLRPQAGDGDAGVVATDF